MDISTNHNNTSKEKKTQQELAIQKRNSYKTR
jgi:hypothetical protein